MKKIYRVIIFIMIFTFIFVNLTFSKVNLVLADSILDYTIMQDRWLETLLGKDVELSDPDVISKISSIENNGQNSWDKMVKNQDYLFSDLTSMYPNQNITESYNNLKNMSLAYKTEGSSLYNNIDLRDDILYGLQWLYDNWYNENIPYGTQSYDNNWFVWEIGAPLAITDNIILMKNDMSQELIDSYITALRYFVVTPNDTGTSVGQRWGNTGANLAWKSQVWANIGILSYDDKTMYEASEAILPNFEFVNNGDGFYEDGSFIQHDAIPYTSGYGFSYVQSTADLVYILAGTEYEVKDGTESLISMLKTGYEPNIYKGKIYDNLNGRYLPRGSSADSASNFVYTLYKASLITTDTAEVDYLNSYIKYLINTNSTYSVSSAPLFYLMPLKNIVNNSNILQRLEQNIYKQYPNMDRVSAIKNDFAFSSSMYSDRVYNYESINGENLMGWHTNDGRTSLYTNDLTQYGDNYWATVDKYRLPGITVLAKEDSDIYAPQVSKITINDDIVKNFDLLDELYNYSPGIIIDNKTSIGNDNSRLRRTNNTDQYLRIFENNINNFALDLFFIQDKIDTTNIQIYGSLDGVNYSLINTNTSSPTNIQDNWYKVTYENNEPIDYNYLEVRINSSESKPGIKSQHSFAGGVGLGNLGISGFKLSPIDEELYAQKSWFVFEDEIVALGSSINSSGSKKVETIIDNLKLDGNNTLTVNGDISNSDKNYSDTIFTKWAHVEGNAINSDIGYYMNTPAILNYNRMDMSGSMQDMSYTADPTIKTNNHLEIYYDHGSNTYNDTYAYTILPNYSVEKVEEYSNNPNVEVIRNDKDVQAVSDNTGKVLMANIFTDKINNVGKLTINRQSSVIMKETTDEYLEISITDPTMKNVDSIDVEVNMPITIGYEVDPRIDVYQTTPTLKFTVNTKNLNGQTLYSKFNLSNIPWDIESPEVDDVVYPSTVIDNLDNFDRVFEKSNNIIFDTANSEYFQNDTSRLKRKDNTTEHITYFIPDIINFSIDYYSIDKLNDKLVVYGSKDNITYDQIELEFKNTVQTGNGWEKSDVSSLQDLNGYYNYLKIEFYGDGPVYSPQIGAIKITHSPIPLEESDTLSDYTKIYDHSNDWVIDSENAESIFNNDYSRLKIDPNVNTMQFITYKTGKIESSKIVLYTNKLENIENDLIIQESNYDGEYTDLDITILDEIPTSDGYYKVTVQVKPNNNSSFMKINLTGHDIQIGEINFEKIEFTDNLDNMDFFFNSISNAELDSSNPDMFNGDKSRIRRKTDVPTELLYYYPNLSDFSLENYYIDNAENKLHIQISKDGLIFEDLLINSSEAISTNGGWYFTEIKNETTIEEGYNYLKLIMQNDDKIYSPQIGSVKLIRK